MNCSGCGAELYFKFHSDEGVTRYLCRKCGKINFSRTYKKADMLPEVVTVTVKAVCACGADVDARECEVSSILWKCTGHHEFAHALSDKTHYSAIPSWVRYES